MTAQSLHKNELVNAHVLLRCADPKHKKACVELKNVLLDNFNNIKSAYAGKPIVGTENFCVFATAKIAPDKKKAFEKALKTLKASRSKNSIVAEVRIDLESN
jgi:hypothetical protein